ncbi:hypothetical protein LTR53_001025 [Teratosphaeriaceae sp. CCFEE 6253]|nr:hypothetical protein LTR53_001025 [Teratosphaeriaceae sp. CCFEE 6253]
MVKAIVSEDTEHFDLISLGTGAAGKLIPWTFGPLGKRCVAIERQWYGGSCPNVACLSSKNVIWSAEVASLHSQGDIFGLSGVHGLAEIDMKAMKQRKQGMVDGLRRDFGQMYVDAGVEVVMGEGRFIGPKTIEVLDAKGGMRRLEADTVLVNTGSRALIPDVERLKEAKVLTHVELLDLDVLPEHLIIIGAGYVGLEILQREDDDVAAVLQDTLAGKGVVFQTGSELAKVTGTSGQSVQIKGTANGKGFELTGSHILCATGRVANTNGIGLATAGIELDQHGFITVDESKRTTADGVYAAGDCAGSPLFTHIGFDDFRIIRDHMLRKSATATRKYIRQVPYTLFTDPELAHVGLRERDAKAQGVEYRLTKLPMAEFLRTRTLGETRGFAKALISTTDDTILGFTAVGAHAGELLPVVQLAMKKGLPYTDLAELIVAHPTLNEGLVALFMAVPPR